MNSTKNRTCIRLLRKSTFPAQLVVAVVLLFLNDTNIILDENRLSIVFIISNNIVSKISLLTSVSEQYYFQWKFKEAQSKNITVYSINIQLLFGVNIQLLFLFTNKTRHYWVWRKSNWLNDVLATDCRYNTQCQRYL
jgi:hypothetical protein